MVYTVIQRSSGCSVRLSLHHAHHLSFLASECPRRHLPTDLLRAAHPLPRPLPCAALLVDRACDIALDWRLAATVLWGDCAVLLRRRLAALHRGVVVRRCRIREPLPVLIQALGRREGTGGYALAQPPLDLPLPDEIGERERSE